MIKVSRGFSKGNNKKGLVEHVVSFSSEGLYHLTGDKRANGISRVMVAYRDDGMARFYGVESLDQHEAYRSVVRAAGFEPVGCYKITKRDAPDKETGGRRPVGERAQQGQITVRASGMLYWDKSISQLQSAEPVEVRTGEGYIEVLMGEGLQLDEPHDGQPARFYPAAQAEEAPTVLMGAAKCAEPHFNGLTPAEAERLALLIEEAAEVQQIATKILRHGFNSYHPDDPRKVTNRELLQHEIFDLLGVRKMMQLACDFGDYKADVMRTWSPTELEAINVAIERKFVYAHHQAEVEAQYFRVNYHDAEES